MEEERRRYEEEVASSRKGNQLTCYDIEFSMFVDVLVYQSLMARDPALKQQRPKINMSYGFDAPCRHDWRKSAEDARRRLLRVEKDEIS